MNGLQVQTCFQCAERFSPQDNFEQPKPDLCLSENARRRYSAVEGLNSLCYNDLLEIMARTPRPLGSRVRIVHEDDLTRERQLKVGRGMLLLHNAKWGAHSVAVYRSVDGMYIYFDPLAGAPIPQFEWYLAKNQIPMSELILVDARLQHEGIRSSSYHSLTFLNYVTSTDTTNHSQLVSSFVKMMGTNTELTAVFVVQMLLSELYSLVDLTFQNKSYQVSLVSSVVEDDYPEWLVECYKVLFNG